MNTLLAAIEAALSESSLWFAGAIALVLILTPSDPQFTHDATMMVLGGLLGAYQAKRKEPPGGAP